MASNVEDRRRSEAGDTLVEILITLTVIGIAAVAILLAFATTISGSGTQRNVATMDSMLRTASAEVTSLIQQQPSSNFAACNGAYVVNNPIAPNTTNIPLPAAGYSATIQYAQYWLADGSGFTPQAAPANGPCPSGVLQGQQTIPLGPQQLTVQVTYKGTSQSVTTIVQNPASPGSGSTCNDPASTLVWNSAPADGSAGSILSPAPTVLLEDASGCLERSDASTVQLSIASGPSGASLNGCVPTNLGGEWTFQNCNLTALGTYRLQVSDPTDGILPPIQANSSFTIHEGSPAKLQFKVSPLGGSGGAAMVQTPPITVWVEDSSGNVLPNDSSVPTLSIGTNPSNGTLSGCVGASNGAGVVTYTGCTIDKAGTGYTLTATDPGENLTTPSAPSSLFNISVGQPSQLAFTTSPGTTVAGDKFGTQPVVTIQDAGGNTVTSNTSKVTLSIGANPGGGVLSGCTSTTTGGVATFSNCAISKAGSGYTLVATDGSLRAATSNQFNIVTAALTSFSVVPSTNTPTAGSSFTATITALDQSEFPFTGVNGSLAMSFSGPSNAPNGNAPQYPSSVSFTNGVGTATGITLYDAQTTTLTATATVSGATGTSGSMTVKALTTPTGFTVSTPATVTAGTVFTASIAAVDTYGNTVTGYTGSKTVTFSNPTNSPSGKSPTYPSSVSFSNGVGSPSITLYNAQTTTLKASASTPTLTGTSPSFSVVPGAPSSFTVSNPGTQSAGSAFSVTITATDAYGNAATNYAGSQAITFSGPSNSPNGTVPTYPNSVTFSGGVGSASGIVLYDAQSTTLTATQGSASGTSSSFTVNGTGTLSSFVVSTPTTQTAGTAFSVTITAGDLYGNKITSYAGAKTVTFSGPANSPNGNAPTYPSTVTFTAGVGTASITLFDAQTTTLTATQGTMTGTSGNFTVNAKSSATAFSVANPGPQTAGSSFTLSVTAVDTYGNTVTGYSPGFTALNFSGPTSSPGGTAPSYQCSGFFGNCTFTNGVATPTVTLYNAQTTAITATQNSLTGTSPTFTVSGATLANAFTVSNPGAQTAGSPFSVTVTATDVYGNTVTGYTGTQSITFSGPASSPNGTAPTYPSTVSFTGGVGTASGITLFDAQTTTLTATQSLITGTSGSFTVAPLGAKTFNVANPGTQAAGTAFNETLTAVDQYGNTATSYTGTGKAVVFSGPANAPNGHIPTYPATTNFTNGVGTASITLFDAQTTTLTATQSLVTGTSTSFTVTGGSATKFTVPTPTTQKAGTAFSVTITAVDTWGNNAPINGSQAVTFSDPDPSPSGQTPTYPATVSFTNGVGTASMTLYDAESTTLTATLGSTTGTTPASFTLTNTGTRAGVGIVNITTAPSRALSCSGAIGSLVCTSTNEPSTSGNKLVASLQLQDLYGNPVNSSGTTVINLSVGSTSGTVSPTSLSVSNGTSTTTGAFTLTRTAQNNKTVTMTAKISLATVLTITMSS